MSFTPDDRLTLLALSSVGDVLSPEVRKVLEETALPAYLTQRRWFASKDQAIKSVRLARADIIPGMEILFTEVEVEVARRSESYQLPLGIAWHDEPHSGLARQLALARVNHAGRLGYLTDAFALDALPLGVLAALRDGMVVKLDDGALRFAPSALLDAVAVPGAPEILRLSAEQSNSSLIVGEKVIMKIIRRVMPGINPEVEMVRYLTEQGYANTPPLLGEVSRESAGGVSGMIVAQAFIHNHGDAWQYTLDYFGRGQGAAEYAAFAAMMGLRLGELHAVLARPGRDAAFDPEVAETGDAQAWAAGAASQLNAAFGMLAAARDWADDAARDAVFVLQNRDKILDVLPALAQAGTGSLRTRIHGDFHLGQILVASRDTDIDAYIIDFEGEPSKPVTARRAKNSPLRDVAGLLRSLDYAAASGAAPEHFVAEMSTAFLGAYRAVEAAAAPRWAPAGVAEAVLLDLFLLEKAAYEICYEAANRPSWLGIPLRGFAGIAKKILQTNKESADA